MPTDSNPTLISRRSALLLPGIVAVAATSCTPKAASPEEVRKRADAIGAAHDVKIGWGDPKTFFVPPFTEKDAALPGVKLTAVQPDAVGPALDGVEGALKIYPAGFISSVVDAIFLCDSITVEETPAKGIGGPAWMVVAAQMVQGAQAIPEAIRPAFHRQTSSMVWKRSRALQSRWRGLMPMDWMPTQTTQEALKTREKDVDWIVVGLLSSESSVSLEADFNVFAETIFENPKRIAELAPGNERIREKAALLMTFYSLMDPRFKGVFKTLGLGNIPPSAPIVDQPPTAPPVKPDAAPPPAAGKAKPKAP